MGEAGEIPGRGGHRWGRSGMKLGESGEEVGWADATLQRRKSGDILPSLPRPGPVTWVKADLRQVNPEAPSRPPHHGSLPLGKEMGSLI